MIVNPNKSQEKTTKVYRQKRWSSLFNGRIGIGVVVLVALLLVSFAPDPASSLTIPTFSIVSVVQDQTVTIETYNFPASQDFVVTMGPMGSLGIDGYLIGYTNSGAGGSFTATYAIPEALKGSHQIAVRLQSRQGYYAYNWFYNNTSDPSNLGKGAADPGSRTVANDANYYYSGIPTISVVAVDANDKVTIRAHNFPVNEEFTVRMGEMYTRGVAGYVVKTFNSGSGGSFDVEVPIPAEFNGRHQISVRAETEHYKSPYYNPYYAYNWFENDTSGIGAVQPPVGRPDTGYVGTPSFMVCSVDRNATVKIRTYNIPANQTFNVSMGYMGALGYGYSTGQQFDSGSGGTFDVVLNVPPQLANLYQISVRVEATTSPYYYAYNWFYNNTADVCN